MRATTRARFRVYSLYIQHMCILKMYSFIPWYACDCYGSYTEFWHKRNCYEPLPDMFMLTDILNRIYHIIPPVNVCRTTYIKCGCIEQERWVDRTKEGLFR